MGARGDGSEANLWHGAPVMKITMKIKDADQLLTAAQLVALFIQEYWSNHRADRALAKYHGVGFRMKNGEMWYVYGDKNHVRVNFDRMETVPTDPVTTPFTL